MFALFLAILAVVACFIVWTYIHEISHVIAAKYLVGLEWYKMKLYPHKDESGEWYWASVTYMPLRDVTPMEHARIFLAPRIPGLVASALFPFFLLLPQGWLGCLWMAFWGAGVLDLVNGSVANSKGSDIRRAATNLEIKVWKLRLLVLAVIPSIVTLGIGFYSELLRVFG